MIGRKLLEPKLDRALDYDSIYKKNGRIQQFNCINCTCFVSVDILVGENPEAVLGSNNGSAVRAHFDILENSLLNGWPLLKIECCKHCNTQYLIYIASFEPRNGWVQNILQGITELLPINNNLKRLKI